MERRYGGSEAAHECCWRRARMSGRFRSSLWHGCTGHSNATDTGGSASTWGGNGRNRLVQGGRPRWQPCPVRNDGHRLAPDLRRQLRLLRGSSDSATRPTIDGNAWQSGRSPVAADRCRSRDDCYPAPDVAGTRCRALVSRRRSKNAGPSLRGVSIIRVRSVRGSGRYSKGRGRWAQGGPPAP